jgi:hypothetical protein
VNDFVAWRKFPPFPVLEATGTYVLKRLQDFQPGGRVTNRPA